MADKQYSFRHSSIRAGTLKSVPYNLVTCIASLVKGRGTANGGGGIHAQTDEFLDSFSKANSLPQSPLATVSSRNGHPFVGFADISPNREISLIRGNQDPVSGFFNSEFRIPNYLYSKLKTLISHFFPRAHGAGSFRRHIQGRRRPANPRRFLSP